MTRLSPVVAYCPIVIVDFEDAPEKVAAIRTIRKLMDFWRIDAAELGDVPAPPPRPASVAPTTRYRHPVSGDTWNGEGAQPDWLRAALLREGYTVDELRAAAQAASSA